MKKAIAVLMSVVVMLMLNGCKSNDTLVGSRWTSTGDGITITRQFNDDGTTHEWFNYVLRTDGVYSITGNEISATMTSITNEQNGKIMVIPEALNWNWSYSIDGDELTLVDLNRDDTLEMIYTRE